MYTGMVTGVFALFLILSFFDRTLSLRDHEGVQDSVSFKKLFSTLLATAVGGGLIFGLIGFGQAYGSIGILLGVVYCASFVGLGLLSKQIRAFVQQMKHEGVIRNTDTASVSLILAKKYNKITWGIISLVYAVIYVGFLSAQYIAITKIISAMGLSFDENTLIIMSSLLVLLYVSIGGYGAVLRTDVLQIIIIGVLLVIGLILFFSQGIPDLSKLPSSYWDPFSNEQILSYFVWLSVFVLPSLLLRLDHWQRIVTAESDKVAKNAYIAAGGALLVIFMLLISVGAYATISGSSDPFWIYKSNLLNKNSFTLSFVYGAALTAFLAAIISSADTILNAISAFLAQTGKAWRIVDNGSSWPAIFINAIITIFSLILALKVRSVVPLIVEGFKAVTVLLPAIVAALFFKRPSSIAATVSAGGGIITYLLIKALWDDASNWAYVISFTLATMSIILVYKFEAKLNEVRLTRHSTRPE